MNVVKVVLHVGPSNEVLANLAEFAENDDWIGGGHVVDLQI